MDIGVVITIGCLAFGFGGWFTYITARLGSLDKKLTPLVILHKKELLRHYLSKGVLPNPSLTPRKQYLIDRLDGGTISYDESKELARQLRDEEKKAREAGDTEALIAILGLIALVAILASLSKR